MFTAMKMKKARQLVGGDRKRPLSGFNLIDVMELGDQTVSPQDITTTASAPNSAWRHGLNHAVSDLDTRMASQIEEELTAFGLEIVSTAQGKALRAAKALLTENNGCRHFLGAAAFCSATSFQACRGDNHCLETAGEGIFKKIWGMPPANSSAFCMRPINQTHLETCCRIASPPFVRS